MYGTDGLLNYYARYTFGIAFGFCIDSSPINYSVKFNSNTGSGSMANQPMVSNEPEALSLNRFTKTGYTFIGWNTDPNGNGTSYTNGQIVSKLSTTEGAVVNLYAQWEKAATKYAVQIYGINQDEDLAGNPLGLTFGPAIGANYNNAYITHTYEETSSGSGQYYVKIVTHTVDAFGGETLSEEYLYEDGGTTNKVTRTTAEKNKYDINMHEMTWSEIQAVSDKTAFLDCMLCGDTKSVNLTLDSAIRNGALYDQYGDGAGVLYNTINNYYKIWNPSCNGSNFVDANNSAATNGGTLGSNARNAGGYSSSHIRATLIGENDKTDVTYAGNVNLSSSNSVYSAIENDLKNIITAKKVKYVTGTGTSNYNLNDDISDKIWLLSEREIYGKAQYSGLTTEGLGTNGDGYDKFGNTESKYYISSYNCNSSTKRVVYREMGLSCYWWLRSPYIDMPNSADLTDNSGSILYTSPANKSGLAFGFCIDSIPVNYTVRFYSNTGSGTMDNQPMVSNEPEAITLNNFTKKGYRFIGWNTKANGTGSSYTNGQVVSKLSNTEGAIISLYAQWEKLPTKYAVQIYGINQDVDENDNPLGLTFGPAVGANYNNSYVTHTYEETSAGSGEYYVKILTHTVDAFGGEIISEEYLYEDGGTTTKVTRTAAEKNKYDINMHEMTWTQIASVSDKTAFLDCMLCGDTKSVSLTLNSTIGTGSLYNQYGDGAGMLYNTINNYYKKWNPSVSDNSYVGTGVTLDSDEEQWGSNARNAGGYSSSHIRATLVGEDSKTNESYAGDVNLSLSNSLYSCIETDLQNVITAKKVRYATGTNYTSGNYSLNDDISDKIWLFSNREIYGTGDYSGLTTEGIGVAGDGYDKFGNNESKYYISSYKNNATNLRKCYYENGSIYSWWLRSLQLSYTYSTRDVTNTGDLNGGYSPYLSLGLAFGFCID